MNRKNLDNFRFVDFDEIVVMEIVKFQDLSEKDSEGKHELNTRHRVDALTKTGLRLEGLFVETQSDKTDRCIKYIIENWINAKSK